MQYFKNVELTRLYPVSEAAVRKWIEGARAGKLELQLYEDNGKSHIANTTKNQRLIEELVARGKKYKNSRGHKVVTPKPEFYELYSQKQIFDIISNIEVHRELPLQYSYFNGGVSYWDEYAKRLWEEEGQNTLRATIDLLRSSFGSIDSLIEGFERVNVIDVGVGNGLPIKDFLAHLLYDQAVLGRYIGIDTSEGMLQLVQRNMKEWFEDRIHFEGHTRDITYERFDDLLVRETLRGGSDRTLNIVLMVGGTLNNLRSPNDALRTIYNSMGRDDILLTTTKLDSEEARRYFDFSAGEDLPRLAPLDALQLSFLNINEAFYDVEQGYNEAEKARTIRIKLKVDLTILFKSGMGERQIELHKGETLLLWRAWHQDTLGVIKQLDRNGLALLHASTTRDRQYVLTVSGVNRALAPSLVS